MHNNLKKQLKELPNTPGVYFFHDKNGEIIYIGKASILSRRVKSYFQKNHKDNKTPILVKNINSIDWIQASSEIEALFLEAEYIKRHKPLYNIELKDDKNFIYIKVTINDEFPAITLVRRPSDDKARYFGPFVAGYQVKQALRYLQRIFPYYTKPARSHSSKIEYQIGILPAPDISPKEYRTRVQRLMLIFSGKSSVLIRQIEKDMNRAAKLKNFEAAAQLRNQYLALKGLSTKIVFGKEETFDIELDKALAELAKLLSLKSSPHRIECYDISNFAGGDAVSSMIVFTNGVPDQKQYRHFKMRTQGPNDFAMMRETLGRRFSDRNKAWPKPDLIIIDGGKGQLNSALDAMGKLNVKIATVGLAKRYETIIQRDSSTTTGYNNYNFEDNSGILHLVQRIRDEAHRFAVDYHTLVRKKRTQHSALDDIPGVGPATRKKLLKKFGSVSSIKGASINDLAKIVDAKKAKVIYEHLGKNAS